MNTDYARRNGSQPVHWLAFGATTTTYLKFIAGLRPWEVDLLNIIDEDYDFPKVLYEKGR